ncbi:glycoside hydrolase family 16 protein [Pseudoalteromonas espejiana]
MISWFLVMKKKVIIPSHGLFDEPMYLIINLAIGGSWGGKHGIDDSIFPQQFLIDYVRVYQ